MLPRGPATLRPGEPPGGRPPTTSPGCGGLPGLGLIGATTLGVGVVGTPGAGVITSANEGPDDPPWTGAAGLIESCRGSGGGGSCGTAMLPAAPIELSMPGPDCPADPSAP